MTIKIVEQDKLIIDKNNITNYKTVDGIEIGYYLALYNKGGLNDNGGYCLNFVSKKDNQDYVANIWLPFEDKDAKKARKYVKDNIDKIIKTAIENTNLTTEREKNANK